MSKQFIGKKRVMNVRIVEDHKTPSGIDINEIEYEDGSKEYMSALMFRASVTDQKIDDTQLRDRRVQPVVQVVLAILRDWGITVGETQYFSALVNQSLNNNIDAAVKELWSQHMPKPQDLDNVSLITVDKVLRTIKESEPSA